MDKLNKDYTMEYDGVTLTRGMYKIITNDTQEVWYDNLEYLGVEDGTVWFSRKGKHNIGFRLYYPFFRNDRTIVRLEAQNDNN